MSAHPFLSETRERFLTAILAELPLERLRELYLFQPIRQGGVESGVAVVAGDPPGDGDAAPEVAGATDQDAAPEVGDRPVDRYTVYTARYRHILKGPDRGKWEASLVAEAEAPLLSIESVVRGVQRRAGDVDPPDHMTAADIGAALRLVPPASDAA